MKRILATVLCTLACSARAEETPLTADEYAAHCAKLGATVLDGGKIGVEGEGKGWFFLLSELQHVGTGAFWKKDWAETSVSGTDPRPTIIAYAKALKDVGVDLVLVPIPPKAVIYADKVTDQVKMDGEVPAEDGVHSIAEFYAPLAEAGVEVIDLEPVFRGERKKGGEKIYCEQDSHPSPHACQLVAQTIVEAMKKRPWFGDLKKAGIEFATTDPRPERFNGDLTKTGYAVAQETVSVSYAGKSDGKGGVEPFAAETTDCPIVLVGDSHTLVFSEGGEMLLKAAGVRDHLQALLGCGVASFGNMGSGVDTARIRLFSAAAKVPEFWREKKAVVWCVGARTFTRERKWREIPVTK